ncbi:MAG: L,D-transpeptidase, partial [Ilumatobacter sp.]|nr:L,D-transpeptidase [Ilumatobacter sp.]MCB0985316.1 L,D-transpeptidase [Ilumatobacter sp.]
MRRTLTVAISAIFVVGALLDVGATPAGAAPGDTGPDTVLDTVADTVPTTEAVTTTTFAPATRGTTVQLVTTLPPPTTTTTTTLPKPNPLAVPANSGSGRRVVYSKGRMRVWVIDSDGTLLRTYLVSGRFNQPNYGTYSVFSRSSYTCNINHPNVCMRWMVRFTKGPSGDNIGFHEIPRNNGVPVQSDAQLGQALSSGCVRQSTADAMFMWGWANIGTKVVVVP